MTSSPQSPTDLKRTRRPRADRAVVDVADRLPPRSLECEMGVIGCIMLSPNDSLPQVILKFGDKIISVFYDLRHQAIMETLVEMYDQREEIDIITLQQRIKNKGMLDQVGGLSYLTTLPDKVPSAANLGYYIEHVKEKATLRAMILLCTDAVGRVYEHEGEVDELMEQFIQDASGLMFDRAGKSPKMKDLVNGAIGVIEAAQNSPGGITGISTGLVDLDKMTGGLQKQDLIVIAARPSVGKTSLALGIAEHVGVSLKLPVGVFSLEMSDISLALRMLCSIARVNSHDVRKGFLCETDFGKITRAAGKLQSAPIHIDDTAGLSISEVCAKARIWHKLHGIKILIVDYLGLMHDKAQSREREVSQISGKLKGLAKELDIPVVVLSQLNRESEKAGKKPRAPRISDIRESGAVEQDADVIGLLYRPDEENEYAVTLDIAKQRNGPTGEIDLTFLKHCTRFESAAKVDAEDMPE